MKPAKQAKSSRLRERALVLLHEYGENSVCKASRLKKHVGNIIIKVVKEHIIRWTIGKLSPLGSLCLGVNSHKKLIQRPVEGAPVESAHQSEKDHLTKFNLHVTNVNLQLESARHELEPIRHELEPIRYINTTKSDAEQ
jgi:hypothetical protein